MKDGTFNRRVTWNDILTGGLVGAIGGGRQAHNWAGNILTVKVVVVI